MLCSVLTAASHTAAQSQDDAYAEAIRGALQEFSEGRFQEARALFRRAHELQPSARTWRGIALASFELQDYTTARRAIQKALSSDVNPLTPAMKEEAEALLQKTSLFLAVLELDVQQTGALVKIDGTEPLREDDRIFADAGERLIQISLPGYLPFERRLRLNAGETERLSVSLEPIAPEAPASKPGLGGMRITALVLGGGAVALGAISLGTGLKSRSIENDLEASCPGGSCAIDPEPEKEKGRRLALTSTITSFSALAAVGAGVALWLVGKPNSSDRNEGRKVAVDFGVMRGGASLQIGGIF